MQDSRIIVIVAVIQRPDDGIRRSIRRNAGRGAGGNAGTAPKIRARTGLSYGRELFCLGVESKGLQRSLVATHVKQVVKERETAVDVITNIKILQRAIVRRRISTHLV